MEEFTEQIINTVFHWWNNGKGDGKNLKDGTLQGMISCIGWALRSENLPKACTVPGKHYIEFPWKGSTLQKKLTNMYSGAKRKVGLARQQGLLSTKDGKLALTWAGIKMLATTFLLMGPDRSGKMEHAVYGALFTLIGFAIGQRSMTIGQTSCTNIGWRDDHMEIVVQQSKTQQEGLKDGEGGTKAVFANPNDPTLCPLLAMALCLFSYPARNFALGEDGKPHPRLFHGTEPEHQYGVWLKNVLMKMKAEQPLYSDHLSDKPEDYGIHSLRKTLISLLSDMMEGPSPISIRQRAGHSLGVILDIYCMFTNAGDKFAGRCLLGLTPEDPKFAQVAPHWHEDTETGICWAELFPEFFGEDAIYPQSFRLVAKRLYATLIWHSEWCTNKLHPDHPIFKQECWLSDERRQDLRSKLHSPLFNCGCGMKATGVPATTRNAHDMKRLQEQLEELPRKLSKTIRDDFTIEGDIISANDFRTQITSLQDNLQGLEGRIGAIMAEHFSRASSAPAASPEREGERMVGGGQRQRAPTLFQGPNGRTQYLPDGYTISCKLPDLCRYYYEGVPHGPEGEFFIAPWRDVKAYTPKDQAALCKFRRVLKIQVGLIWANFQSEIAAKNPTQTPIADVHAFVVALDTWPIQHRRSLFTRSLPLLLDRAYGRMGTTAVQKAKDRAQNLTMNLLLG
jgi:hypothetical protein